VSHFASFDLLLLILAGVPIVLHDLRHHLITNSSLRRFASAVLAIKLIESLLGFTTLIRVFQDAAWAAALFLAIYWLSGSALGVGDVKLAPILAALAGLGSIRELMIWVCIIWAWGGACAFFSVLKWRTLHRRIAFAPALIAGTVTYLAMGISSSLPQ